MSDPGWLQKYKEENPSGGQRGWLPGQSGNPAGRPKGSKNKKTALVEAFENDGTEIARVVIRKALEGDMQAANICLQRISPPLRARAEKVTFELTPDAPLTTQAQQILTAVSAGDVDPETGQLLINCIASFAGLKATDELEARIKTLEGKQI
jgi:hypothetical protein